MEWVKDNNKVPIKSWCKDIEESAMEQANKVANHPCVFRHVALMPDCHTGYGMPIGGVCALVNAVSPNMVGVDIGCGMGAVKTNYRAKDVSEEQLRKILDIVKSKVPVGFAHYDHNSDEFKDNKKWIYNTVDMFWTKNDNMSFSTFREIFQVAGPEELNSYLSENLGTMGSNNHFLELQKDQDDFLWLMVHSGSRNVGFKIANFYNKLAVKLNEKWHSNIPHKDLSFLPCDSQEGQDYIALMNFALEFARENRAKMMRAFEDAVSTVLQGLTIEQEVNIHHNFAAIENHFGKNVWVHRKGATSAKKGELGIIPGSMGTPSYIVEGLGNPESFMSSSHGAGRIMGRMDACRNLNKDDCDKAMEGVIFDGWSELKARKDKDKGLLDFGESPLSYKDIDEVIEAESDLVKPLVKLQPLAVIKG